MWCRERTDSKLSDLNQQSFSPVKLCVSWPGQGVRGAQSADLVLVLVRWLCSKFCVQLSLAGLVLLPEFWSIYSGAPAKGEAVPRGCFSHGKWHRCQRNLMCVRSFKVYAQKWHSATSAHMLLAKLRCKAKANVKEQASALCFL